jgi:hypothetical protein
MFDWKRYINYYSDLKNNIFTEKEAIKHWNIHGINEGRYFFKLDEINNFDWNKYIEYYKDLNYIKTKDDAIEHWYKYGKYENRIFFTIYNMDDFDWIEYINFYDDLKYIYSKNDAIDHWLIKGIVENRIFFNRNKELFSGEQSFKQNTEENNSKKNKEITIFTSKFGIYIAQDLKYTLEKINISSKIVYEITEEMLNDDSYYIILFAQLVKKFPKKYIIYQLEQVVQSNWINKEYISKIESSIITMDYSINNIFSLQKINNNLFNKICYNPIPIIDKLEDYPINIEYDILFYGTFNDRRNNIFKELKKYFNVLYICNIFGDKLHELIKKSKIILNIHFYKNAVLEIPRIHEIIRYNKVIISELPMENDLNKQYYNNNIIFIEEINDNLNNINLLIDNIKYYLNNNNYNNYLDKANNNLFINQLNNNSLYYLKKNINNCFPEFV